MNAFRFGILLLLYLRCSSLLAQTPPATIPDFAFPTTGGSIITKAALETNKPLLVFYFDPDCDHCNKQASFIKAEQEKLAGIQILMVSFNKEAVPVAAFQFKYFANAPFKTIFVTDPRLEFDKYFGNSQVPTLLAYNAAGKFIKKFTEETPVTELAAALKQQ